MFCWKNSLPSLKALCASISLTVLMSAPVIAGETIDTNRSAKPHQIYVGTGLLFNNFSLGYRYHFAPQWALGGYIGPNLWGSAGSTGVLIGPNLRYYLTADPSTFFIEASAIMSLAQRELACSKVALCWGDLSSVPIIMGFLVPEPALILPKSAWFLRYN